MKKIVFALLLFIITGCAVSIKSSKIEITVTGGVQLPCLNAKEYNEANSFFKCIVNKGNYKYLCVINMKEPQIFDIEKDCSIIMNIEE